MLGTVVTLNLHSGTRGRAGPQTPSQTVQSPVLSLCPAPITLASPSSTRILALLRAVSVEAQTEHDITNSKTLKQVLRGPGCSQGYINM